MPAPTTVTDAILALYDVLTGGSVRTDPMGTTTQPVGAPGGGALAAEYPITSATRSGDKGITATDSSISLTAGTWLIWQDHPTISAWLRYGGEATIPGDGAISVNGFELCPLTEESLVIAAPGPVVLHAKLSSVGNATLRVRSTA